MIIISLGLWKAESNFPTAKLSSPCENFQRIGHTWQIVNDYSTFICYRDQQISCPIWCVHSDLPFDSCWKDLASFLLCTWRCETLIDVTLPLDSCTDSSISIAKAAAPWLRAYLTLIKGHKVMVGKWNLKERGYSRAHENSYLHQHDVKLITTSYRILSNPKHTIVILHRVCKTTLATPREGVSYQLQCCSHPRSEYAFVIFQGSFAIVKNLYESKRRFLTINHRRYKHNN